MANRYFKSQFSYSNIAQLVNLFAKVSFGNTGAPTLDAANSVGIKSIVRNSAGDYTITLQDGYNKLLMVKHIFDESSNSGTAPVAPSMFIKAKSVSTASGGTIEVVFNAAGTATDPASGEIVLIQIMLNNSSVTY